MEWEQLITDWKNYTDLSFEEKKLSREELQSVFESQTKNSLQTINRNMRLDAILMSVVAVIFITLAFVLNLQSRLFISLSLMALVTILLIHYRIKYLLINKLDWKQDLRSVLQRLVNRLRLYMLVYKIAAPILVTCLYIAMQTNMFFYQYGHYQFDETYWIKQTVAIPVALVAFTFISWLTHKLYGRDLKNMQENLEQLSLSQ